MRQEFEQYLDDINVPLNVRLRIRDLCSNAESTFDTEYNGIFVVIKKKDEDEVYTSLWLLNDYFVTECKNFMTSEDLDILVIKKNLGYCFVKKSNYDDFNNPSSNSFMKVNVSTIMSNYTCDFEAYGMNCKYLKNIFKSYLLPNVTSPQGI